MKLACVYALADLALKETSEVVSKSYNSEDLTFGPNYLIPKPFDPRLFEVIPPAVAKAAMETGVATRPIQDLSAYQQKLHQFNFRTVLTMRPIFNQATTAQPKRLVLADGEEERVLRATQAIIDEKIAYPVLIGRPPIINTLIERLGLRIRPGKDFDLLNLDDLQKDATVVPYAHLLKGKDPLENSSEYSTILAASLLYAGRVDAMLCGIDGRYYQHLKYIEEIIGRSSQTNILASLSALLLNKGTFFIADTHINAHPTAEELARIALLGYNYIKDFGIQPKAVILSHTNDQGSPINKKIHEALTILARKAPDFDISGAMQADFALDDLYRKRFLPDCQLEGQANFLMMPTLEAANITYNTLRVLGEGITIGPMLMGTAKPVHILTPAVTARGILNMSALAVTKA